MRIHKHISGFFALTLSLLMVISSTPVSAADLTTTNTSIGSVSGIGSVNLRGVRINNDGTLFSGDQLSVGAGAYAKLSLKNGPKIEVGAGSDVTVSRDANGVTVEMKSGNVAFTGDGQKPVHVRLGSFEVTTAGNAAGNVMFIGSTDFGVRVINGSVLVRNSSTKQSFTVQKGNERLVSLQTGVPRQSIGQLASSAPSQLPTAPAGAPQQPAKSGLSRAGWFAVIGTIAGATTAIAVLATRNDNTANDESTKLAQQKAAATASAAASTAAQAQSAITQAQSTLAAAQTAIAGASSVSAPTRATLAAQATALTSQATASMQQIAALQQQLTALQTQLQGATDTASITTIQTQINTVVSNLNSDVTVLNATITALNSLLQTAASDGVPNVPTTGISTIPPAPTASASVPL